MKFRSIIGRLGAQSARAISTRRRGPARFRRQFTPERLEARRLLSLTINTTFDSTIQTDFPNHYQQLESAFNYAAAQFQNLFSGTSATITLDVKGSANNSDTTGLTLWPSSYILPQSQYSTLLSKLPALPASYPSSAMQVNAGTVTYASESGNTVTIYAANHFADGESATVSGFSPSGYNGTYTITATSGSWFQYTDTNTGLSPATTLGAASVQGAIAVPLAEARALGLYTGSGTDGTIIFDSNNAWDFNPADRTDTSGGAPLQDFIGVAEHEIAHALGRISFLGQVGYGQYAGFSPLDLQRYADVKQNNLYVFDPQASYTYDYLSPDRGTSIEPSYPLPNVGDPADWAQSFTGYNTQSNGGSSSFGITAATQGGLNVNVTSNNDYIPGEEVKVSGLTPSQYDGFVTVTAASATAFSYAATPTIFPTQVSESGTTMTVTASNSLQAGNQVVLAGISRPEFNGAFTVTSANSTSFQCSAYAGPVQSATESGTTVTITAPLYNGITSLPSLQVGDSVLISGVSVAGYNGTFSVSSVNPYASTFTYTDTATGLANASGGTATPTNVATASIPSGVTWTGTQVKASATVSGASAQLEGADAFNGAADAYQTELSPQDVQNVMEYALGYQGVVNNQSQIVRDDAVILQESFTWNGKPVVTLFPGATYTATLLIANTGSTTWSGDGSTWAVVNPPGGGGLTVYLPTGTTINPGISNSSSNVWQVSFAFVAPSSGNEQFQMIHEGKEWFGELAQANVEGDGTGSAATQEGQLTQLSVIENGTTLPITSAVQPQNMANNFEYLFRVQHEDLGESDWLGATPPVWTLSQYTTYGGANYNGSYYAALTSGANVYSLYDNTTNNSFFTAEFNFLTQPSTGGAVQIGLVEQNVGYFGQLIGFGVGAISSI